MKNGFTFGEFLLVVSLSALFVALALGMTPRDKARTAYCADKMHRLLQISHQYVSDHRGMWMAPCDLRSGAYVRPLSNGKYIKTPWKTLMTARETELTCPELPRVSHWKVVQGYGAVYNNGSSYDPQIGIYIYSPEYDSVGTGKGKRRIEPSKRIWFADSLNILEPPFPSPLLFGHLPKYPKGGELFGTVNITHAGGANIGAVDGSVTGVAADGLNEYFFPVTGGNPLRHYSAPLRLYIDRNKAKTVAK